MKLNVFKKAAFVLPAIYSVLVLLFIVDNALKITDCNMSFAFLATLKISCLFTPFLLASFPVIYLVDVLNIPTLGLPEEVLLPLSAILFYFLVGLLLDNVIRLLRSKFKA